MDQLHRGPLLLIGGAEDKIGHKLILHRFIKLAGGADARIVVIATASAFLDIVGRHYVQIFGALGARQTEVLRADTRLQALQPESAAQLAGATGVFITGGDQLKLTEVLGGTAIEAQLRRRSAAGAVVGGTSAGASAVATHMLAYGQSGAAPRKSMMQFAPGLGLIDGVVVDQHFGVRGRAGRLMTAVAHNPGLLGLGIDEDTAAEIDADGRLTVRGRGSVSVFDGAAIAHSDLHYAADYAPFAIFGMQLHTLPAGYHYDLASRTPHLPTESLRHPETGYTAGEGI